MSEPSVNKFFGLGVLKIFCCILGSDRLFPVDITEDQTVGDLKEAIKKKKEPDLDHLPADALDLWKVSGSLLLPVLTIDLHQVSIPEDANLQNNMSKFVPVREEVLKSSYELSEVFVDPPARKHLHIIVRVPLSGGFHGSLPSPLCSTISSSFTLGLSPINIVLPPHNVFSTCPRFLLSLYLVVVRWTFSR